MVDSLIRNVRYLKESIRNSNGELEDAMYVMVNYLRSISTLDYNKFFEILLEDDFDRWIVLEIKSKLTEPEINFTPFIKFIISASDRSTTFCERICSQSEFAPIIKSLVTRTSLSEDLEVDILCIINNVTFNYDDSIFRDGYIKEFLLRLTRSGEKCFCVVTLMRLSNQDEIRQFEDIIWTFVPEVVGLLEECCQSVDFKCTLSHLDEILRYIETLCRSLMAKKALSENFNLLFKLRLILTNGRFKSFASQARGVLHHIYSDIQIDHIEKEVADQA